LISQSRTERVAELLRHTSWSAGSSQRVAKPSSQAASGIRKDVI
jgi:hypothetical protein